MNELKQHLLDRIRSAGPLTWADYMEAALYDPDMGFFSGPHPVGTDAPSHFATSATISPVFASLVAAQARLIHRALDRPDGCTVVDLGAGDGALAAGIKAALAAEGLPIQVVAVEQNPVAREALAARDLPSFASLDALPDPITGLIVANEVFDNLPFHRVRRVDGALVEIYVAADGDALVERIGPVTAEVLGALRSEPDQGHERPVSPAALEMVRTIAGSLSRGYAMLFDYGWTSGELPEPVRGYHANRLVDRLLADPGRTDITGPVDLDALIAEAQATGLKVWGPVSQRQALLALGYREAIDALRLRQRDQEGSGRWRDAISTFAARGEASMLVDPAGLGAHRVVAFGTAGLPPPRALEASP